MKFKDKCDICNKFAYCHGYKGKCVCEECLKKLVKKVQLKLF